MPGIGSTVATFISTWGPTAATVASAAAAVHSMTAKGPSLPSQPPALQMPNGAAAAMAASNRARGAAGLGATNLTGPQGLTDPATTSQKTLLGG